MSYYEAIIQLRPKDEKIIAYVKNHIKDHKEIIIAKELTKNFGTDLYINSKKQAWNMGQELKKKFPGELKVTKKIFKRDRDKGKIIYRHTICFRLFEQN